MKSSVRVYNRSGRIRQYEKVTHKMQSVGVSKKSGAKEVEVRICKMHKEGRNLDAGASEVQSG